MKGGARCSAAKHGSRGGSLAGKLGRSRYEVHALTSDATFEITRCAFMFSLIDPLILLSFRYPMRGAQEVDAVKEIAR